MMVAAVRRLAALRHNHPAARDNDLTPASGTSRTALGVRSGSRPSLRSWARPGSGRDGRALADEADEFIQPVGLSADCPLDHPG
jgi:hypothetical protein